MKYQCANENVAVILFDEWGMSVLNKFASGLQDMERYAFNGASLF